MDFKDLVYKRRSNRTLSGGDIPMADVRLILEAGLRAPNACNYQSWHLYCITNKAKVSALIPEICTQEWIKNASIAVVITEDNTRLAERWGKEKADLFVAEDAGACAENMLLMAAELGYAGVFVGAFDEEKCKSCGKCEKACPYHAIVYIPVPCEEACPVGAISKDEYGVEHIDESKCIYCGKCMNACPFGAIFEISQVFDVLQAIRRGEEVVAMVAPSILSQYNAPTEQVYGAIKAIGFKDVIEVARGAEVTTEREAHEFAEKLAEGQPFMTTSCCPSYMEMARKHAPDLQKYISSTYSPMVYTADIAREKYPNAKFVFVGPCIAKRKEARRDDLEGKVHFVLTFEEIHAMLKGMNIELGNEHIHAVDCTSCRAAHGFAENGGVTGAVKQFVGDSLDFTSLQIAGLNKKSVALLKAYGKTGKAPAQFIEVMACEGGCISGPSVHTAYGDGKKTFDAELKKR